MNSPAHVIFSLALLGRPNAVKYAVAITAGALLPDAFMLVFYAYEKFRGVPEIVIWRDHYYEAFWQNLFDATNSIPLLSIALLISISMKGYTWAFMFGSMIIHCLLDLPVHHDDGHRHFFPISDFRFQSPVSYWNPDYHGNVVGLMEMALFLAGIVYLWNSEHGPERSFYSLTRLRTVVVLTTIVYCGFFVFVASPG
ncbi:MAG: hypothetical protein ACR2QW_09085 [bacterium]